MGQDGIEKYLEQNKQEWFSSKQLATAIGINLPSAQNNIRRMRESNELQIMKSKIGKNNHPILLYKLNISVSN